MVALHLDRGSFTFTIPTESGFGSGSISTSFSGSANELNISSLTINGAIINLMSNGSGQSAMTGGIPITAGQLNTIRVVGTSVMWTRKLLRYGDVRGGSGS